MTPIIDVLYKCKIVWKKFFFFYNPFINLSSKLFQQEKKRSKEQVERETDKGSLTRRGAVRS